MEKMSFKQNFDDNNRMLHIALIKIKLFANNFFSKHCNYLAIAKTEWPLKFRDKIQGFRYNYQFSYGLKIFLKASDLILIY